MQIDANVQATTTEKKREAIQNVDDQFSHVHFGRDDLTNFDEQWHKHELRRRARFEGGDRVDVVEDRDEIRIGEETLVDYLLFLLEVLIEEIVTKFKAALVGDVDHVRHTVGAADEVPLDLREIY